MYIYTHNVHANTYICIYIISDATRDSGAMNPWKTQKYIFKIRDQKELIV